MLRNVCENETCPIWEVMKEVDPQPEDAVEAADADPHGMREEEPVPAAVAQHAKIYVENSNQPTATYIIDPNSQPITLKCKKIVKQFATQIVDPICSLIFCFGVGKQNVQNRLNRVLTTVDYLDRIGRTVETFSLMDTDEVASPSIP